MMIRTSLAAALMAASLALPALAHEGKQPDPTPAAASTQVQQATPAQLAEEMAAPDHNGE